MDSSLPLWIIEDCTWPVMWGLLTITVLGFIWFLSQRYFFLLAAIVVAGLVIATIMLEMKVVTDKEYVVNAVYQMAEAVRSNDPEELSGSLSPKMNFFKTEFDKKWAGMIFEDARSMVSRLSRWTKPIANLGSLKSASRYGLLDRIEAELSRFNRLWSPLNWNLSKGITVGMCKLMAIVLPIPRPRLL